MLLLLRRVLATTNKAHSLLYFIKTTNITFFENTYIQY